MDNDKHLVCVSSGCRKSFPNMGKLRTHIAADHLHFFPYECKYCECMRTASTETFSAHMKLCHPDKPPGGALVDLEFDKSEKLRILLDRSLMHSILPQNEPNSVDTSSSMGPTCVAAITAVKEEPVENIKMEPFEDNEYGTADPQSMSRYLSPTTQSPNEAGYTSPEEPEGQPTPKRQRHNWSHRVPEVASENEPAGRRVTNSQKGSFCTDCKKKIRERTTEEHVLRHHLAHLKFLSCPLCDYANNGNIANMRRHIKRKHNESEEAPIDKQREFAEEIERMSAECFGPLRSSAGSEPFPDGVGVIDSSLVPRKKSRAGLRGSSSGMIAAEQKRPPLFCEKCSVATKGVRKHIYMVHLKKVPVMRCPLCNFAHQYESATVRDHIRKTHPDSGAVPKDCKSQYESTVQKLMAECFPNYTEKPGIHDRYSQNGAGEGNLFSNLICNVPMVAHHTLDGNLEGEEDDN